jgi:hypothetical protein
MRDKDIIDIVYILLPQGVIQMIAFIQNLYGRRGQGFFARKWTSGDGVHQAERND